MAWSIERTRPVSGVRVLTGEVSNIVPSPWFSQPITVRSSPLALLPAPVFVLSSPSSRPWPIGRYCRSPYQELLPSCEALATLAMPPRSNAPKHAHTVDDAKPDSSLACTESRCAPPWAVPFEVAVKPERCAWGSASLVDVPYPEGTSRIHMHPEDQDPRRLHTILRRTLQSVRHLPCQRARFLMVSSIQRTWDIEAVRGRAQRTSIP